MDIVLIAPFEGLKSTAEEIVKEKNLPVDVALGDLSEGVRVAKEIESKGVGVIISRGGTYQMIKEAVSVPVVEIQVSAFDILRALKGFLGTGDTIGAVGYENVVYGVETLAEIMDLNIYKVIFKDEDEAPRQVYEAARKGIKVFVGDTIGIRTVKEMGLKGNLITSGKEAILQAIDEAFRVLQVRTQEKARTEQFKAIIDFVHDGIIAVDSSGNVSIFNRMAESIFKKSGTQIVGKNVNEVIETSKLPEVLKTGKPQLGKLQQIGDIMIATNRVPIIVDGRVYGAVATFQDVTQIQKIEQKIRRELYHKGLVARYHFEDIVHKSRIMEDVIGQARKYAHLDSTVLILGETGTGKELFAQSIHNESPRSKGPFVAINCAALPENLLESELFGYTEGAFTGARKGGKMGVFELAHKGTIFLDEIGDMPLDLQSRLLRVIQEKEVMRIGDDRIIPVDVRIIASTNKNLEESIERGEFRKDLYYRLNILSLKIPPLRERREDIPLLAEHFARVHSSEMGKEIKGITEDALRVLLEWDYPGNVRQLEGIIERAVALSDGRYIDVSDIRQVDGYRQDTKEYEIYDSGMTLKDIELKAIKEALEITDNNKTRASKLLGIDRTTLWRRLRKLEK